jgi:DNA adenine methylase
MKPPFAYYGGKSRLAPLIASLLPPHRVYVEPFFGSGAVLFAKRPAVMEIVNDLDESVVTFFRVLRTRLDELEWVCSLSPYARDEFRAARLDEDLDELEVARRFWVRVNQSFVKTARPTGGWSVTVARNQGPPVSVLTRLGRFADCAERLLRVSIEHADGIDVIERLGRPDAVMYVDPPYLSAVRSGGSARDYKVDMGGVDPHVRLAEALRSTPATVVLSGYPGDLYDEMYADWWHMDVHVHAHASNARRSTRSRRTERIWSNRELAHDAALEVGG